MPTKDEIETMPTIKLMFLGLVEGQKGLAAEFIDVSDEELTRGKLDKDLVSHATEAMGMGSRATRLYTWSKDMRQYMGGSVGSVWAVKGTDRTIVPGTAKFLQPWPNSKQRAQWQAEARAMDLAREARKREDGARKNNAMLEQLAPFRVAYARCRGQARTQLIADVVRYISGGQ